jgi:ABC-type uncharacterized transport system permease subunit
MFLFFIISQAAPAWIALPAGLLVGVLALIIVASKCCRVNFHLFITSMFISIGLVLMIPSEFLSLTGEADSAKIAVLVLCNPPISNPITIGDELRYMLLAGFSILFGLLRVWYVRRMTSSGSSCLGCSDNADRKFGLSARDRHSKNRRKFVQVEPHEMAASPNAEVYTID